MCSLIQRRGTHGVLSWPIRYGSPMAQNPCMLQFFHALQRPQFFLHASDSAVRSFWANGHSSNQGQRSTRGSGSRVASDGPGQVESRDMKRQFSWPKAPCRLATARRQHGPGTRWRTCPRFARHIIYLHKYVVVLERRPTILLQLSGDSQATCGVYPFVKAMFVTMASKKKAITDHRQLP